MIEYYELVRKTIPNPEPGEFLLVTAAIWACALCNETIDGMGGPGDGEICIPCGNLLRAGRCRNVVTWNQKDKKHWQKS